MLPKVASILVKNGARLGSSGLRPLVKHRPLASRGFYINNVKNTPPYQSYRTFSSIASEQVIFHSVRLPEALLSKQDCQTWDSFLNNGVVFVQHEGHCSNTLITELKKLGVSNIVLVSKDVECSVENRVSNSIIIDDFNDLETNYSKMMQYCLEHSIKQARVLVGWGYSSESQQVPIQSERVNNMLPDCDFQTPCNSVSTLQKIADKDAFDQTVSQLGLNVIPNFYNTYKKDFDDSPRSLIKFAQDLFDKYPKKNNLKIFIKHPSTGGGRGIVPITFNRNQLNLETYQQEKIDEIKLATALCHNEGKAFLEAGVKKPLVLQMGIEDAKHIELQFIGKKNIGKRECSAQERGQKKAEGTISLDPSLDKKINDQAQIFANENDLNGANTLELLVTDDGDFYFLETNTRLQVEHLVTVYEKNISLVASILAQTFDINLENVFSKTSKNAVRHIRLTGLADGQGQILTDQTEMQQKMNAAFGEGVVEVRIKKNSIIDPLADQQFGALVIKSDQDNPILAKKVLTFFEENFQATGLTIPYRTIYSVLEAYIQNRPFKVGEYIPPTLPTSLEIENATLYEALNKQLNGLTVKGETKITIENFKALQVELEQLLVEYESKFPKSQQITVLSDQSWHSFWRQQPNVTYSVELRDYLQSQLAHVTHPFITGVMQRIVDRLSDSVAMYEAPGVSGAGPQTSAMLHGKCPESNRFFSHKLICGLERGVYMNALEAADSEKRSLMKWVSHQIERRTYGEFEHLGKQYSNYVVTDFDASNNSRLNARMVFENMLFLRPAYMTLSWNPTMTNDQIRQYLKNQFNEYKRLQHEFSHENVPNPLGYYIKCPSTTDKITTEKMMSIYTMIDEEYQAAFGEQIVHIKWHAHNLIAGENKDHQTKVALAVADQIKAKTGGPKLSISGTFALGGYGASHPDLNQLEPQSESLAMAHKILDRLHHMMAAFDVSKTVAPEDPSFEGPGGMAASAFNDLKQTKARYPENKVIQALTYEQSINLGVSILGMRTLVTPLSQFNFLAGIEIAKEYGVLTASGNVDIKKTKAKFNGDLNNGNCKCTFPKPVLNGMQSYNPDFPNPEESTVGKILQLNGLTKQANLPEVLFHSDIQLQHEQYVLDLEKKLGYPPSDEDVLTALRFGSSCDALIRKTKRGAGTEVLSPEDFLTQRKLKEGDEISSFKLTSITEKGLSYVAKVEKEGKERIISVPNNTAIELWISQQLSTTPKYDGAPLTFSFDSFINAKVSAAIPKGTIIEKKSDGTITYFDQNGSQLPPIDPLNPGTFAELVIMKMSQAQKLPKDLPVGRYEFDSSDFFDSVRQKKGAIHPGTRGHRMYKLTPLGARTFTTMAVRSLLNQGSEVDIRINDEVFRATQTLQGISVSKVHRNDSTQIPLFDLSESSWK